LATEAANPPTNSSELAAFAGVSNPRGSLEDAELEDLAPGSVLYHAGAYWEAWMPKERAVAGNGMVESHLFTEFADAERWLRARLAELVPALDEDGEHITCYDGLIQDAKVVDEGGHVTWEHTGEERPYPGLPVPPELTA